MLALLCPLLLTGCGSGIFAPVARTLTDPTGQPIYLDDVEAIVRNPDLTEDEKRRQLRDLGIQDEKLIDALLTL
ncbi:MAG: hypothetical protein D6788_06245 [Planctomycetota bacterium]|nr:MAG: hypothetical protein D6788_06245 [Planctomycetota bacterium]